MSVAHAGPYALEGLLGRGGSGDVFRGRAPDGTPVAVKWLRSDGGIARFEREVRVQTELAKDGGFVPILGSGEGALGPWIAMPLLTGGSLRDRLRQGPLPPAQLTRLGRALAGALGRAHALGFVHRDVKPENILFDAEGRALLADLGLAKHCSGDARLGLSRSLSLTGELRGTIGYLAPECVQDSKHADARADVFSLGAVLYECACGAPAFEGATPLQVLERVAAGDAPPLRSVRPEVALALARVIERCLARDPAERFLDGASLATALRGAAREPVQRGPSRRATLVSLASLATLVVAAGVWTRGRAPRPTPAGAEAAVVSSSVTPAADALATYVRAVDLFQAGRMAEATVAFDEHLAAHPDHADASFMRATIRYHVGDLAGARADLDRALREGAVMTAELRPRAHAARGGVRRSQGDVEGALADLRIAVSGAPDDPVAQAELADTYVALGRLDEAHEAATQALAREPKLARAMLTRATVYCARGDVKRALVDAQGALDADPSMHLALLYRALARLALGEPQGAEDDLSSYLEHDPGNRLARISRADARVRRGALGLGIADYDLALSAQDDPDTRLKRARALVASGNAPGADADFEQAAAQGMLERALAERAMSRANRGDLAGALADADRLLVALPRSADGHLVRAAVLERGGDRARACDEARHALSLAPPGSPTAQAARILVSRLE